MNLEDSSSDTSPASELSQHLFLPLSTHSLKPINSHGKSPSSARNAPQVLQIPHHLLQRHFCSNSPRSMRVFHAAALQGSSHPCRPERIGRCMNLANVDW